MRALVFILIITFVNVRSVHAQKDTLPQLASLNKNALYISGATLGFTFSTDFTYERIFMSSKKRASLYFGPSVSMGVVAGEGPLYSTNNGTWDFTGVYALPNFVVLKGKENKYLEFSIGFVFSNIREVSELLPDGTWRYYTYNRYLPQIALGYRKYFANKKGVFRIGFSIPKGVYLSLGTAF